MEKAKTWFLNLSRIGKLSVISTVALCTIAVGATNSTPPESTTKLETPVTSVKKPVVTTDVKEETKPIPFVATQREDGSVAKGTSYVETAGVNGVETITHTITLTDGTETNRVTTSKVTLAPINHVTVVGTYVAPVPVARNCDPNYSGCVPNVSYDLDCSDIGYSVIVLGYDRHGFDGDGDGEGCESY